MRLIVGLGNIGEKYNNTRHNIGFKALDRILNIYNIKLEKNKFNGYYEKIKIEEEEVIFLKPAKYMNLSGEVIRDFVSYFKININDILIISDDLDQKLGNYKLKQKGSSGGHNGLKDIEKNLNTSEYKRLKIGISNNKTIETKDYVLGKISNEEQEIINKVLKIVPDIFEDYLKLDFNSLMNKYNHKN